MTTQSYQPFTAVVLAADRTGEDPVARAQEYPAKRSPRSAGAHAVSVLDALEASNLVNTCMVCGPPAAIVDRAPLVRQRLSASGMKWLAPRPLQHQHPGGAQLNHRRDPGASDDGRPRPSHTRDGRSFRREALATDCDVVAALASHALVMPIPGNAPHPTRFSDGAFCGCNLFAFLTAESRTAQTSAASRKRSQAAAQNDRPLGWMVVLRYLLGGCL